MSKNQTVLITGSSKGLGKSLALLFSQNHYNVILHGRSMEDLLKLREIISKNNVECDVICGDITLEKTIIELSETAKKRDVDILINNAGIYLKKPFPDMVFEEFRKIIEVNLLAPVHLINKIFPILITKKTSLIININSFAGKNSSDGESAYNASKHGLRGFSNSLQFDATTYGIRIIDVYLGSMNTGMVAGRKDPEKCISTNDAADIILGISKNYSSMRITEIDINRRIY